MAQWGRRCIIVNIQNGRATQEQILQLMTTEHFTLQTARSATIAESNGRSALFIGTVSSAVVALAFVGQVSEMSKAFFLFGLVLFPSLLFLGVVTFVRLIQTGIEDMIHGFGIKQIRRYYVELAPEARRYLIHSIDDDAFDALESVGIVPLKWQLFLTNSGMVAVINGVIAGVFAGMLVRFTTSLSIYAGAGSGIVVFIVSVYGQYRYQSSK
jgi:hypothetical protein